MTDALKAVLTESEYHALDRLKKDEDAAMSSAELLEIYCYDAKVIIGTVERLTTALSQGIEEIERLKAENAQLRSAQMPGAYFPPIHSRKKADMGDINSPLPAAPVAPCKGCNATPCHCDPRDPCAAARRGGYEEA